MSAASEVEDHFTTIRLEEVAVVSATADVSTYVIQGQYVLLGCVRVRAENPRGDELVSRCLSGRLED